jgi:hypothetical protein
MNVKSYKHNPETGMTELVLEDGNIILITDEMIFKMAESVPEHGEEKMIRNLLVEIYEVRKKRVLTTEGLDKDVESMRGQHKKYRDDLGNVGAKDKIAIYRISAQCKDLAYEKVLLGERRQLIKILWQEESDLRGRLAKILVSKGRV